MTKTPASLIHFGNLLTLGPVFFRDPRTSLSRLRSTAQSTSNVHCQCTAETHTHTVLESWPKQVAKWPQDDFCASMTLQTRNWNQIVLGCLSWPQKRKSICETHFWGTRMRGGAGKKERMSGTYRCILGLVLNCDRAWTIKERGQKP